MSRTTLEIDESLLAAAMEAGNLKTKTEAIELALREFIRSRERELLRQQLGTFDLEIDLGELLRLRQAN